ncbi:MAG TPA: ROK family protein [Bacteroidales bacterium]|nr:ROK family protein [Bacteroidales bacterium]
MKKDVVLGIDIGGTFTKFGLVSEEGNVYHEDSVQTNRHDDIRMYIKDLKNAVEDKARTNGFNITGIGVGAPNGNFYKGTIEFAPNLPWKGVINLSKLFEEEFKAPATVTNDANAAAMGEMLYGNAQDISNFIMITLGTGLGSGLVVNGELIYGHDGFAGELGHTTVFVDGRQCACGRKGCLETYVSAPGIKRTVFEMLGTEIHDSCLRKYSFEDLDARMISEAALENDPLALKAFDFTGKILGLKLADAVAHTSPEAIFLFGGLANAGDLIFEPVKKYMEQFLLPIFRDKVKIEPSALQHKNIAVLGAAALMWNEMHKKA